MVTYYAHLKSLLHKVPLKNAPDLAHAEFFAKGAFGDDLVAVFAERDAVYPNISETYDGIN
jgi:hypothetical protein